MLKCQNLVPSPMAVMSLPLSTLLMPVEFDVQQPSCQAKANIMETSQTYPNLHNHSLKR